MTPLQFSQEVSIVLFGTPYSTYDKMLARIKTTDIEVARRNDELHELLKEKQAQLEKAIQMIADYEAKYGEMKQ